MVCDANVNKNVLKILINIKKKIFFIIIIFNINLEAGDLLHNHHFDVYNGRQFRQTSRTEITRNATILQFCRYSYFHFVSDNL